MIIYKATKRKFVEDVFNNTIANEIDSAFFQHLGRHTSPNEVRSWENSMQYMYKVVNTPLLPDDAGVAIEYQIPLTAKRVDFILSGLNAAKEEQLLIVELKQWEKAKPTNLPGVVVTRFQHGEAQTVHPSYQAWTYAYMLKNYNITIQERAIKIQPCAYLHNYQPDNIIDGPKYAEYTKKAPVFLRNDASKLQQYIEQHIKYSSKDDIIWQIDGGRLRPSKQLADALASMLQGNEEFKLLDDQKVVYEQALSLAMKSQEGKKQVLIVEGGPGTGKSVLAVNLLVKLTERGIATQYVTKNQAPRDVYLRRLQGEGLRRTYINSLFVGSGTFTETQPDTLGALVVDEAHRLNMKSGMFANLGENQVKEIIRSSRFSVFFIDDNQRIHIKDIGSIRSIKQYAEECGCTVHLSHLSSQFRCNGSDGYLSWVDNALQIRETANFKLTSEDFDFRVYDSPVALFDAIKERNKKNNKSRVVAGYCWDWKSQKDPSATDINFPEFGFYKKWNLKNNEPWLIGEHSIEQIGCIHTCQGLELDYVGVIIGPDMTYDGREIVTDVFKRSSNDRSIHGFRARFRDNPEGAAKEADAIIKNTYRTLMTRGMKGCYVYCCDKALAQHFRELLSEEKAEKSGLDATEAKVVEMGPKVRVEDRVNDDVKFVDFLPLYSIKAACGYFGEGEDVSEDGWVRVEGLGRLNRNMYVVRASGHSMEPRINDGDYCVFKSMVGGSRQGKIVLVQHHNFYDGDYSGSYSIKEYNSTKSFDIFGGWQHEEIRLHPLNPDYEDIVITEEDGEEFMVVGEFIGVVG